MHPMNKADLRKQFIKIRNALPGERVSEWSQAIQNHLLALITKDDYGVIAAYAAFRNEPLLWETLKTLLSAGKTVALPKCEKNGIMAMYKISSLGELETGAYGILEPPDTVKIQPDEIDLILCPGCAFSLQGERMGYGGGYYDRYLPLCTRAIRVGVCYEMSLVDSLPTEAFDVKMDFLITEKGLVNKL